jgi:hypothetical protein
VNHKRVYRLYKDEGLGLRRKKPKRRRAAMPRQPRPTVSRPNERWTMDFMSDALGERPGRWGSEASKALGAGERPGGSSLWTKPSKTQVLTRQVIGMAARPTVLWQLTRSR